MVSTLGKFGVLSLIVALAFAATMALCQDNDIVHPEAPAIRSWISATNPHNPNGPCDGFEMYYAMVRGTVLVLCGYPNSSMWGGMVIRCTENMGTCWIDPSYTASTFGGTRRYWMSVVARDGYVPLVSVPSVRKLFIGSYW